MLVKTPFEKNKVYDQLAMSLNHLENAIPGWLRHYLR